MAQRHCYELAAPAKVVKVLELKSQRCLFNLRLDTRRFDMFVNKVLFTSSFAEGSLTALALGYRGYLTTFGWWYWVMVVDSSPGAKIQRQNNQQENERDGHTD